MTDERCKQLMEQVGMPDSISLMFALKQVANETELECRKIFKDELQKLQEKYTWGND